MKLRIFVAALVTVFSLALWGQEASLNGLGTLRNARYVYVTSYDGTEFSQSLLSEDRAAIAATQNAIEQDGRFVVVYQPWEAEMIIMVQSRPSEDLLAVYDPATWPGGSYRWRATQKGGLSAPDVPLVKLLEATLERVASAKPTR